MIPIAEEQQLDAALASHPAVLVLYGGRTCGVCQAIKPQLEAMLAGEFTEMAACYVDCQGEGSAICAQQRVFSLPVVQLWFEGQPFDEFVRVFSIGEVRRAIQRPYAALFDQA
ncbi:MAG: thioredoxin family protein [Halomonas sp.]|uniref:thioredoxin family protein n=1 Tax=Halomonas sp. TaxID=1486246 RepID=UPI0028702049|nr:thioredoxin family protein [Halomonas sp.]MDR9439837.1 thioredoxin family protein [Halomonas sp.]